MIRLLAAAALVPVLCAAAHAAPDAFDQGVDVHAALSEVRAQSIAQPGPVRSQAGRYQSDCAQVTLRGTEDLSAPVQLRSQEWIEECHYVPGGDPRHGGGGGGQNCWTRPGNSWSQTVRVRLSERKALLPWEYDSFQVCLEGPWLDARPLAAAYDYKYDRRAGAPGELVFTPGAKRAMKPDPSGLWIDKIASGFENNSPYFMLDVLDKWGSYYAGEKTKFTLEVKEDLPNWFDPTVDVVSQEIAAGSEHLWLSFKSNLKPGRKYYVKVSYQRIGTISSRDTVYAGRTASVTYQPAGQAAPAAR